MSVPSAARRLLFASLKISLIVQLAQGSDRVVPQRLPAVAGSAAKKAEADAEKKREELAKAVKGAYKGLFYDNNFEFINNPLYDDWFLGDVAPISGHVSRCESSTDCAERSLQAKSDGY